MSRGFSSLIRMLRYSVLGMISLLQMLCTAGADELSNDLMPVAEYAVSSGFIHAGLSPGGDFVFLFRRVAARPEIQILGISAQGSEVVDTYELPPSRFRWAVWADRSTLLVAYVVPPERKTRDALLTQQIVSIDISSRKLQLILAHKLHPIFLSEGRQVLSTLEQVPDEVLLSYAQDGGFYPGVYRLNYKSFTVTEVEPPTRGITKFYADWQGNVRLAVGADRRQEGIVRLRESPGAEWSGLDKSPVFEEGQFQPIVFSHDGESLYVRSAIGTGRFALYEFDLQSKRIVRRLFEHPKVDVGQVIVSVNEKQPAAVTYVDDTFQIEPISENYARMLEETQSKLPGYSVSIVGNSSDGQVALVHAEKVPQPPELYAYFRAADTMVPVRKSNLRLADQRLSMPERETYFSRDGLEIQVYLTYPQVDDREQLPTIIMPHGGPAARDLITFDYWAQFLASRGYLVVQPNFRGSSGYGWYFQARGFGEWGGAMQDDLTDAVRWLVDDEISDPERICIVGASYGGYAALMGVIKTPGQFKCAVSFAPVTDLNLWIRNFRGTPIHEAVKGQVRGSHSSAYLKTNSPARQAGRISAPLLLIHGNSDMQVSIEHSENLVKFLKKTDVEFRYIELDGGSHFLFQQKHRLRVLTAMQDFLASHIGIAH